MKRIDGSGNDRLQSTHQRSAGDNGIDAEVRLSGVGSAPDNLYLKEVSRRHDRPVSPVELALRHGREIMHAKDETHGEPVEQAALYYLLGAANFLRRLEYQVRRAPELPARCQVARGGQQHGGVSIVSTRVHHAWIGRCVGYSGLLGDRQGIDIGPQANGIVAVAPMNHRDHACPIEVVQGVYAEGPESFLNERAGAGFGEAELRVCVQIPAPANHFFVIALYFFENLHRGHLLLTELDRG